MHISPNRQNVPEGNVLGNIWGAIPFKIGGVGATVFLCILAFICCILLVTGVVLWPFLISCRQAAVPLAESAGQLVTAGIVGAVVSLVTSILLAFLSKNFRFSGCLALSYAAGLVAVILSMVFMHVNLAGFELGGVFAGNFLLILFQGILAILLALLPALVSATLGWLVHAIGMLVTGRGGE